MKRVNNLILKTVSERSELFERSEKGRWCKWAQRVPTEAETHCKSSKKGSMEPMVYITRVAACGSSLLALADYRSLHGE